MQSRHDLTFAMRSDQLISIDEVSSGLHLDCLCPACRCPLVAKKGQMRRHHFAHWGGAECGSAVETALHLLAKKIICCPGTTINLPTLRVSETVSCNGEITELHENAMGLR